MREDFVRGVRNRLLQSLARRMPGARSIRIWLHRMRGVTIGKNVFIGTDAIIETARPDLVIIGNRVVIGIRTTLLAHFDGDLIPESKKKNVSLHIGNDVFIGPGAILLPNVRIGDGSIIAAGSVVTRSVPSRSMVQGNPAQIVAKSDAPLNPTTSTWNFLQKLRRKNG